MSAGDRRYRRVLERLHGLARFGMRPGLDATAAALAAAGHPEERFSSLHIAGTNGKGSTAAFAESVLRAAGARVGLYTSPHLLRFTERIRIAGDEARPDDVAGWIERALDGPGGAALTFFEAATVAAFIGFAEQGVEVAVVECGLGGRLDATSTCRPFATVVTRIGLDHMEVLGSTVEKIAFEKAGIARQGVPLIVGPLDEGPRAVVEKQALAVGAPLLSLGRDFRIETSAGPEPTTYRYLGPGGALHDVKLGLLGDYQADNAALALAALAFAPASVRLDDRARRMGLSSVRWPARLERLAPDLIVDGAHNPDAARALARALAGGPRPTLVIGLLADKDVDGVLSVLVPIAARVVCTQPTSARALPAAALLERVRALFPHFGPDFGPDMAFAVEDPAIALDRARCGGLVVVCGSLFLAGAVRGLVLGETADPLAVRDPVDVPSPAVR